MEHRLKHITFTGVDAKTDKKLLSEIQKQYPVAEFGVLTSYHWYENGNRYIDPRMIVDLPENLNLSLHICGSATMEAMVGYWEMIDHLTFGQLFRFKRIQLNIANRKGNIDRCFRPEYIHQEIIIQQKSTGELREYCNTMVAAQQVGWQHYFSVLLDASGGRGIDTEIKILQKQRKVGYAGGITPDNVEEKLLYLLENHDRDFWIDMESGVRTNDQFDLSKVQDVLEKCDRVLYDYENAVVK